MASAFPRLLAALLLGLGAAAASAERVVMVLGDSLSAGYGIALEESWTAILARRLGEHDPPYRVANVSISGETTRGALARLPEALERHAPEVVVVELGGNDGLRGIPLDVTRRNLAAILEAVGAAGARALLLGMRLPPNYGPRYAAAFHGIYAELADEHGAALVPFFLEGVGGNADLMQADGIHPTAQAQPVLLENVWPRLEPLL